MSTIKLLPGAVYSPKVCLHHVLEDADNLDGIYIITLSKDGRLNFAHSELANDTVAFMLMTAMGLAQRYFADGSEP